jgi:predicted glycosyltransferase
MELAAGTPALLVPRETPRLEQRIRAERLAARGAVEYCVARDLGAARIAGFVRAVQQNEKRCRVALRLDGLDRTLDAVFRLLGNAGDDATAMGVASHATSSR